MPVAARTTPAPDPRTGARRPAPAQRAVLVCVRLLTRWFGPSITDGAFVLAYLSALASDVALRPEAHSTASGWSSRTDSGALRVAGLSDEWLESRVKKSLIWGEQ